ncbi:MAG: hypothetical protein RQ743_13535 [Bacteroidales bacterium]|nr:hypothetical protein [Bacteroidales bacterium]
MIKQYFLILAVIICSILPNPVKAQIEKVISIQSTPEGALIYEKANRNSFLGKTPLDYNFSFHSEKSMKKITLEACGYYDTTIVIDPGMTSLNVEIQKKPLLFTVDSQGDVLTERDVGEVRLFTSTLMEAMIGEMQGLPVNIMDYIMVKKTGDTININIGFTTEPENIGIRMTEKTDSVIAFIWNNWFKGKVCGAAFTGIEHPEGFKVYLSMVSSSEKLAIKHIPGVDVRDVKNTNIYQTVTPRYIYTTIETYFYTESDATFNYSLEKDKSYYEFVYTLNPNNLLTCKNTGYLFIRNSELIKSYGSNITDGFLFRRIIKDE